MEFILPIIVFILCGLYAYDQLENKKRREQAQKAFDYIMEHGTFNEKQLAILYKQSQDLERLRGLVGIDILMHL